MSLRTPSPEELFKLLRLVGGSHDQVVALLAKQYDLPPDVIAPTVLGWLEQLPEAPPPSRQRSAPPNLAPSNVVHRFPSSKGPEILPIKTPPSTAPAVAARGNMTGLMAAMRAVDSRLNQSTQASFSHKAKASEAPMGAVGGQQAMRLMPPSVPEDAPLVDMDFLLRDDVVGRKQTDDPALRAYMERYTIMHGSGVLAVGAPGKRAGGWNYG
jgi:hypothetical protein